MLSTGEAARLCGVKPDTILKWIHQGRLQATQTPGGHFRLDATQLAPLRSPLSAEALPKPGLGSSEPKLLRCWEYMAAGGEIPEACLRCVAYRIRAAWCFEVRKLGCDVGLMSVYCQTACEDCLYYQRVTCTTTDLLLVTVDVDLVEALSADKEKLRVHVARNGYEASALIGAFRPTFAVIDLEMLSGGETGLLDCLRTDRRACGLRIILAEQARKSHIHSPAHPGVVATLRKPFGSCELLRIIQSYRVETLPNASLSPPVSPTGTVCE